MFVYSFVITFICIGVTAGADDVAWYKKKAQHKLKEIKLQDVDRLISGIGSYSDFNEILDPILIPRVSGSKGNRQVRQYIIDFMKKLNWDVETDSFNGSTPLGVKPFTNIVATLNPSAPRHLVFACHYDSKLNREYTFIGATDSAVPCAMMMSLAKDLDKLLKKKQSDATDLTLQLVFFDGEEAFVQWTSKDSLYGARHLANKWQNKKFALNANDNTNELHRKDVLILLDLLGASNPSIYNYFSDTKKLLEALVSIEKLLDDQNLLKNHNSLNPYFKSFYLAAGIEDDHIPFLKRGVPILHLIPVPFPRVWHLEGDNKDNLDFDVIDNLNKILGVFTIQYLHLPLDDNSS